MRRDSNPTGCGAEETRKRFPAQHARSGATQRKRAAEAARGHPAGGTNFKMFEPAGCKVRRVRSFAVIRRKVLNALALDEQFAFFSLRAGFAQHLGSRREHDGDLPRERPRGHTTTQRMQEIQAFLSTRLGSSLSIAPTGHTATQAPQAVHSFVAIGTIPVPPAFL